MPFRKTLVVAESSDGYEGFKKLASRHRLYDADYSHFSHAPSLEAAASLMAQDSWTSLTYVCGDALTAEQVFDQILAFENDGQFQPCLVLSDADKEQAWPARYGLVNLMVSCTGCFTAIGGIFITADRACRGASPAVAKRR